MEGWGCEFIGEAERESYIPRYEWLADPSVYVLDIETVMLLADPNRLAEVHNDVDRLERLERSIRDQGQRAPGIVFMSQSTARLQEGYHRLLVCLRLQRPTFPVRFERSPVKSRGVGNADLVEHLLKGRNGT